MSLGVRYPDHVVTDADWQCVADVIATYHGTTYIDEDHRVTGELVRRSPSGEWVAA